MVHRALIYGICLIGIGASAATAQIVSPAPTEILIVDGARQTPDVSSPVPEVIKPSGARGDVIAPRTSEDPAAVLNPPNVDPLMRVERPGNQDQEKRLGENKAEPR